MRPRLSESTALWWSLGGTIGAYGLVALGGTLESGNPNSSTAGLVGTVGGLGMFLAPSFGHWYAGKYWTRGLGLRLGSIAVLFGGLILALASDPCPLFGGHDTASCDSGSTPDAIAIATVIAAGGMFVWGTIDDIVDAPRRVRRMNAESQGLTLSLAPLRSRDGTGLALVGRW